jgi:hypothetical protein
MNNGNFRMLIPFFLSLMDTKPAYTRCYSIAGISIQVEADIPITDDTFDKKFKKFQVDTPGADLVRLRYHFSIIPPRIDDSWQLVYKKAPWAIYKKDTYWIYLGISGEEGASALWSLGMFDESSARGLICYPDTTRFLKGNSHSLTFYPTDQIVLARMLPERQALYIHAAGMILYDKGVLFVGHSEAGKSTTVTMLKDEGEILCDDRIIVRRGPEGFRIHGTWSHGTVSEVSGTSAPLHAIFFLEKSVENSLEQIEDRKEINRMLPFYLIKPVVTADWWEKSLDIMQQLSREVPVYRLRLDTTGKVKDVLRTFLALKSAQ